MGIYPSFSPADQSKTILHRRSFFHLRLDHADMDAKKIRMILKFDTGADGFMKMIYVLAGSAVAILIIGTLFLMMVMKGLRQIS